MLEPTGAFCIQPGTFFRIISSVFLHNLKQNHSIIKDTWNVNGLHWTLAPLYRQDFRKSALLLWYPSIWLKTQPRGTFTSKDVWQFQKVVLVFRTEWWEWHLVGRGQCCCWPSYHNWTVLWEAFPGKVLHECLPTPDRVLTTKKWFYRREIWWMPRCACRSKDNSHAVPPLPNPLQHGLWLTKAAPCSLCIPYTCYKLENASFSAVLSS